MNSNLVKLAGKTPKEQEEWKKAWANGGFLFRPLYALLQERINELERYTERDFDTPNHYAKLVYRDGRRHELEFLKSLLPDSVK